MSVQLVETGIKFPDGTTQTTAAGTGVTSVNGFTGAVTLENLGFANLGSQNGYQKLPGGLIIQWGRFYAGIGFTFQSYPIVFPNALLAITNCYIDRGASGDYRAVIVGDYPTIGAYFGTDNCTTTWIALGY
jgi:hypothetical protein